MINSYICVELVKSCKDVYQVKQAHARIIKSGLHRDQYVGNTLIQMYGRFGHAEEADRVMSALEGPTVFSYNILIRAFAQNGCPIKAQSTFDRAPTRNCASWNTLMSMYTSTSLDTALFIFEIMPARDSISNNTMLSCFAQNGLVHDAESLFHALPFREDISWTGLLNAYENSGLLPQAHQTFSKIPLHNIISCTMIIRAYALEGHVQEAAVIFSATPVHDIIMCNVMITCYGQAGCLREMQILFEQTPQRDVISWTAVTAAYAARGEPDRAKQLFHCMPCGSLITSNAMIGGFARSNQVYSAALLFAEMPERDLVSWNSLLDAYTREHHRLNLKQQAEELFHRFPCWDVAAFNLLLAAERCSSRGNMRRLFHNLHGRDWLSWTTLLGSSAQNGHLQDAFHVLHKMPGWSTACWSALAEACAAAPDAQAAKAVFDAAPHRDLLSWTALITADAEGYPVRAERTLARMPAWDAVPWTAVVEAWAPRCLDRARAVFESMPERTVVARTAMIAANARHGQMQRARETFNEIRLTDRDSAAWNAMIGGYSDSDEALELFWEMNAAGCPADEITFICLLTACSRLGLVRAVRSCFHSMLSDHGLIAVRDHYCCVVDALSRAGELGLAQELIESMPCGVAGRVPWMTLISACRTHGDSGRADSVADRAIRFFPDCSSVYAVLASLDRDHGGGFVSSSARWAGAR